jgi:hypothetical protein
MKQYKANNLYEMGRRDGSASKSPISDSPSYMSAYIRYFPSKAPARAPVVPTPEEIGKTYCGCADYVTCDIDACRGTVHCRRCAREPRPTTAADTVTMLVRAVIRGAR